MYEEERKLYNVISRQSWQWTTAAMTLSVNGFKLLHCGFSLFCFRALQLDWCTKMCHELEVIFHIPFTALIFYAKHEPNSFIVSLKSWVYLDECDIIAYSHFSIGNTPVFALNICTLLVHISPVETEYKNVHRSFKKSSNCYLQQEQFYLLPEF